MNPERMRARGLAFVDVRAGQMLGFGLRFNKRASGKNNVAYANVAYAPMETVEGVLYELPSIESINDMDQFEGCPYRYSRDVFSITSEESVINAWVYVANRAMIAENLFPERQYLNHLLAGKPWQSDPYHQWLANHACVDSQLMGASDSVDDFKNETKPNDERCGLKFNV
jgi:gamma-glutamylcyclotransferase (GGCT)/AIG2-like uncharacterized protein YtfP